MGCSNGPCEDTTCEIGVFGYNYEGIYLDLKCLYDNSQHTPF